MGMACIGLTHCSECWSPLEMGEFGICKSCEEKQKKEKEKHKQEMKDKELRNTIKEEAKDIMKEFVSVMAESKVVEQNLQQVEVFAVKPEKLDYNTWYSKIGFDIIKSYLQGNKEIKVKFIEESNEYSDSCEDEEDTDE